MTEKAASITLNENEKDGEGPIEIQVGSILKLS